jgi:plasmid maintenance system antidote protein VapI
LERDSMGRISVTPIHIGAYVLGLLRQLGSTADELSKATGLSSDLIADLIVGQQILTADVALALGDFFEVSPLVLLKVQASYCMCRENSHSAKVEKTST